MHCSYPYGVDDYCTVAAGGLGCVVGQDNHLVTMPQGRLRVAVSMQRKSIKRRYFRRALSLGAPAGAERMDAT